MLKDPSERLRRAIKENNLYLVRRIVERHSESQQDSGGRHGQTPHRFDIRNTDPVPRYTSLAWAAVSGHEEIFEYLLNMGHDEEELSRDAENNTILILLAGIRNPPNSSSSQGREYDLQATALRMARMYYDRYPYLIDWSNVHGKTALHVAATKGNEEFVRMFCDLGADFDLPDLQGNTPLHYASAWNHVAVLQLLIERGCQFAARNNEGFTASDYAFSFSTMNTLQETARAQFENNKRARRHIFAQAAARGVEREKREIPSSSLADDDLRRPTKINPDDATRFRSGSGGSRTTASNSDLDHPQAPPIVSTLPSKMRDVAGSTAPFSSISQHTGPMLASLVNGGATTQLAKTSVPIPLPNQPSVSRPPHAPAGSLSLPPRPAINGKATTDPTISPVATRMRERDADAMAEYMKRTRSGSNGTASAMGPSSSTPAIPTYTPNSSNPSTASVTPSADNRRPRNASVERLAAESPSDRDGEAPQNPALQRPLRRLRPSNSAASLRPTGIIGMPSGISGHGHSNSAVEIDLINEVLSGINHGDDTHNGPTSFLPELSPIENSPVASVRASQLVSTKPLDIKPRQKTLDGTTAVPSRVMTVDAKGSSDLSRTTPISPLVRNAAPNSASGHRRVQDSR